MPRLSFNTKMSEIVQNHSEEVNVSDVYDIAAVIGNECERIIDLYGLKSVESLIPKCIIALEMLEGVIIRFERERLSIQELNERISKLENEKVERAKKKERFEKVKKYDFL